MLQFFAFFLLTSHNYLILFMIENPSEIKNFLTFDTKNIYKFILLCFNNNFMKID